MSTKVNVFVSPSLFTVVGIAIIAMFTVLFEYSATFSTTLRRLELLTISHALGWSVFRTFLVALFCIFWTYRFIYLAKYVKAPTLYYCDTPFNKKIVEACNSLRSKYFPTFWMLSPHLQLVFAETIKKQALFNYRREFYKTPDGGTVCLDWVDTTTDEDAPILILLHGLTGGSHSKYLTQLAHYLTTSKTTKPSKPWRPVVYVRRGCGVNLITSAIPYTYANTDDLRLIIKEIQKQFPKAPLYAAGFSMGGNILCKYLGEEGSNTPIKAATTICGAFEIKYTSQQSENYANKFYQFFLLRLVRTKTFLRNLDFFKNNLSVDIQKAFQAKTLREFDEHFTIKLLGHENVDTYYETCHANKHIPNIAIPMLIINALDDPIVLPKFLPFEELLENKAHRISGLEHEHTKNTFRCALNENIILCITDFGGHHSFLEGIWPVNHNWIDRLVTDYLETMRSAQEKKN